LETEEERNLIASRTIYLSIPHLETFADVLDAVVSELFRNPDVLLHEWDNRIEAGKASLRDPGKKARTLARHITELDQQKARAQDLAILGLLDPDDLAVKLGEIDSQRLEAQRELENAAKGADRLRELEDQRALFPEFARAVSMRPGALTPEEPAETYRFLNLRLEAKDREVVGVSGDFERIGLICTNETPTSAVSAPTRDP
jgi:hypothetical protein